MFYCMPLFAISCSGTCNFYELCPLPFAIFASARCTLCHFSSVSCKLGRQTSVLQEACKQVKTLQISSTLFPLVQEKEVGAGLLQTKTVLYWGGGMRNQGQGSVNMSLPTILNMDFLDC